MGYECQFHNGAAAGTLLLTNLRNGVTASSCEDCAPAMYAGALATTLGLPLDGLWGAIERYAKRAQKSQPADTSQPASGDQDVIKATCPYCGTDVMTTADDIERAKASHLANCDKVPEGAQAGGA